MRKRLFVWELAGFLFTVALGTLLHFTFHWSGGNDIVAAFSAVNESTWEHMKLVFFPFFLFTVVEVCFLGRNYPNFLGVRALSVVVGVVLIPTLFYTYTGIWGKDAMWANITVFVLSVLIAFWLDYCLLRSNKLSSGWQQVLGLLVLWGLAFLFVWCTFRVPNLALWQDPVTLQYGILQT